MTGPRNEDDSDDRSREHGAATLWHARRRSPSTGARRDGACETHARVQPTLAPREGPDVARVTRAVEKMVELLGTDAGVKSILKFGPKDDFFKTDRYEDVILAVDWKPGVEMGGIQGRVHAHVWATISHISQVQVDVHKLQYLCRHLYNQAYARGDVSFPATFNRQRRGTGVDKFLITKLPYVHVKLLPRPIGLR